MRNDAWFSLGIGKSSVILRTEKSRGIAGLSLIPYVISDSRLRSSSVEKLDQRSSVICISPDDSISALLWIPNVPLLVPLSNC
ncbi:hypothetical protein AAHA92_07685 [Salvia divinorum]|uniref:Uncharacterized protein n=1 Tax=Salvia divinorum TaxID=28513 RepID=A0ABD1ICE8_SALDI